MRTFQYIDLALSVVPVFVGLWSRRFLDGPLRLFLIRITVAFAADGVSAVLAKLWIPNGLFVQGWHLVDNLLLVLLFSALLRGAPGSGLIRWVYPAYLAAFVAAKFTIEPLTVPDQYTYTAVCVVMLGLSIALLLRCLGAEGADPVSNPWTWIAFGLTASFASNLLLFSVLSWYVTLPYEEAVRIYSFHWIGNILVNGIYTVGLLKVGKRWTTGG